MWDLGEILVLGVGSPTSDKLSSWAFSCRVESPTAATPSSTKEMDMGEYKGLDIDQVTQLLDRKLSFN